MSPKRRFRSEKVQILGKRVSFDLVFEKKM